MKPILNCFMRPHQKVTVLNLTLVLAGLSDLSFVGNYRQTILIYFYFF